MIKLDSEDMGEFTGKGLVSRSRLRSNSLDGLDLSKLP